MQVFSTREASAPSVALHALPRCRTESGNARWNHPYRSHHSAVGNNTTAVTNVAVIANSTHVELLWRGLRAGMPRPWRVKALRSDGQVIPVRGGVVRGGVDATRLLGQRVGPISAWCGREEAAGLPAHSWLSNPSPPPARSPRRRPRRRSAAIVMLASAVELGRVMAEHGRILPSPANRRPSGPEVLQKLAPRCRPGPASRPGSSPTWPTTGSLD
jgi:hypothetical protein